MTTPLAQEIVAVLTLIQAVNDEIDGHKRLENEAIRRAMLKQSEYNRAKYTRQFLELLAAFQLPVRFQMAETA